MCLPFLYFMQNLGAITMFKDNLASFYPQSAFLAYFEVGLQPSSN